MLATSLKLAPMGATAALRFLLDIACPAIAEAPVGLATYNQTG